MDSILKQLRSDIEYKFGATVNSKSSSVSLSDKIYEACGERVSYNTIRRFFGLTNPVAPRQSTLDIFARYVGASSFLEYCNRGQQEQELLNQSNFYSGTVENACGWDYKKLASGILKTSNDRLKWHTLGLILRNLFLGEHYDKIREILALDEWDHMRDFDQLDLMNKHINDLIVDFDKEEQFIEWIKHTNYVRVILACHVDQGGAYPALMNQLSWVYKLSKVDEEIAYAGSVLAFASMVKGNWQDFEKFYLGIQHLITNTDWNGFLQNRLSTLDFVYHVKYGKGDRQEQLDKLIQRNLDIDAYFGKWTNDAMVAACICMEEDNSLEQYLDSIMPTERDGQRFFYETEIGNWHLLGRMYLAKKRGQDPYAYADQLQVEQLSLQKHWFFNFMLRKIGMPEMKSYPYGTISCRLI